MANLSLLAFGFRAPEILLTTVELVGTGMPFGQIGPLAVTGSTAFNLLVIAAVCNQSVEDDKATFINVSTGFVVTSVFSIIAYV